MARLNETSGFNLLLEYYQKNKERPWTEWLKVDRIFPRPGRQGLVGIMTSLDLDSEGKPYTYVFKISRYLNYITRHELTIMQDSNELADFCPNFSRAIGVILCRVDPGNKTNPFELKSKHTIEKEVLLMQYIDKSYKLYNYLKNKVEEKVIYSLIKQTLLAISIAQKRKEMTHYDLHSNNIMVKRCSRDLVFLYVIDQFNQFAVPSYGYYPILIDYGFGYSKSMQGQPFWATLNHSNVGFFSDRYDPVADPKLFLVSVSDELKDHYNSADSKELRKLVKHNYASLSIRWDCGWDKTSKCATDYVLNLLAGCFKGSKLFAEYEYYCIDLLQSMIILPLQQQDYEHIHVSATAFIDEFSKIEKEISTPFYCLFILQSIIDIAREIRSDYVSGADRDRVVSFFKKTLLERIDSVADYCLLKTLKYEKLLCALYCLTKGIEGLLYDVMNMQVKQKEESYKQIPWSSPEEICGVIEEKIPSEYEYNEKTAVLVIDNINGECSMRELTAEEAVNINEYQSISQGTEMYKLFSKKKSTRNKNKHVFKKSQ